MDSQEYQPGSEEEDLRMLMALTRNDICKSFTLTPIFQNNISQQVRKGITRNVTPDLEESSKKAQSQIIEDFIASYIEHHHAEDILEEDIVIEFLKQNFPEQISIYIEQITEICLSLNPEELISDKEFNAIKDEVLKTMKSLGISESELQVLKDTKLNLVNINQASNARDESYITVSIPQIVRKAYDYKLVSGTDKPFPEIVKAIMHPAVCHELAHKADKIKSPVNPIMTTSISYHIPITWENNLYEMNFKGDRFAEYVLKKTKSQESLEIYNQTKLINFIGSNRLWNALEKYNKTHEDKLDLTCIFEMIKTALDKNPNKEKNDAKRHLSTREGLYSYGQIEAYLIPFSDEQVEEAIGKIHSAR